MVHNMQLNIELILLLAIGLLGWVVQLRLRAVFAKYSKVRFSGGLTGAQVAEKMLRDNGILDVSVTHVAGTLTDHYNPQTKTVNLSDSVYGSSSVSAVAVAAHECGHAVQHARGYAPLKLRSALVPAVQFSSNFAMFFVLGGLALMIFADIPWIFWVGIGMLGAAALFSIVTLPVEYDASARALAWMDDQHLVSRDEHQQARQALSWAARTYLVAALAAVATIIYYLGFARRD